jgi:hypothetical protein
LLYENQLYIDHDILIEKVLNGINDAMKGRSNTKEEGRQKLNQWLK